MIKIEHPEIDVIAQEYFDLVKGEITKRAKLFELLFEQIFCRKDRLDQLVDENWSTLKSFTNILLTKKICNINEHEIKNKKEAKSHELKCKLRRGNSLKDIKGNASNLIKLFRYLSDEKNLKALILATATVNEVDSFLLEIDSYILDECSLNYDKSIILLINKIIDYDILNEVFQDNKTTIAYWLTQRLNINTCPYCNRIPIHTVLDNNKKGLIHPTLDHFYPKSKKPLLALSFYNLIPSCYYCNSSLKGSTDMDMETHLHPYVDGFGGDAVFSVDNAKLLPQKSHPDNYNITLTPSNSISQKKRIQIFGKDNPGKDNEGDKKKDYEKVGNKNLFKIVEIYQVHRDIVGELVVKAEEFKAKQENVRQFYSALATNDSELYQFYFGNYLNPNDHHKRPLAKLTRDIVLEILPEISF